MCMVLFLYLLQSVVNSGYSYMFDNDEFFHAQVAYLIHEGYVPYKDIYLSVYPPYIHYFLRIVYMFNGYNFESIYIFRLIMIGLFLVRLGLIFFITTKLFGKFPALLACVLFILFPITVYSEMQIRLDNIMITCFLIAVSFAILAWEKKSLIFDIAAGFFTITSLFMLLKILPSVAVFLLVYTITLLINKSWDRFAGLFSGVIIGALILFLPFILQGTQKQMIQQTFLESFSSYSGVFEYPIPLGFFFHSGNPALHGVNDKPITWIYMWVLLFMAGAGMLLLFQELVSKQSQYWKKPIFAILLLSFIGQHVFLFLSESVFIQHYTSMNWLFGVFASIVVFYIYRSISHRILKYGYTGVALICLLFLVFGGIKGNQARATIHGKDQVIRQQELWSKIPENEPVFPNILFRKLGYMVPHGHFIGNIPETILKTMPSIPESLDKTNTNYVYIDTYTLERIPADAKYYIQANFTQSTLDPKLFLRQSSTLSKPE